jgi:hypothetical protein
MSRALPEEARVADAELRVMQGHAEAAGRRARASVRIERTEDKESPQSGVPDAQEGVQTLVVELPLPDAVLHPNKIGGANRYAVTRARAMARRDACRVASSEAVRYGVTGAPYASLVAHAIFYGISPLTDADNAHGWLKSVRDGIADALMGGNDHGWRWGWIEYQAGRKGIGIIVELPDEEEA